MKHVFGLVTTARRRELQPGLFYIFAEPAARGSQPVRAEAIPQHRQEAERFRDEVAGDEVLFSFASYHDWLPTKDDADAELSLQHLAVLARFAP